MSNNFRTVLITICIVIAIGLAFVGGCNINIFRPGNNSTPPDNELDTQLLKEAYQVIIDNYVEPDKVELQKLNEGILKGLVQGLNDPYSAYLTPEQFNMSVSDLAGQFEGIGAYVGSENGLITIIAPIPDTPAAKAGIQPGDIILEVNGQSTTDMSVNDVVLLIRGPKGTSVTLTVLHKDAAEPATLEITRAEIQIESVILELVRDYAHITITTFTERTDDELKPILDTITRNDTKGIVLDLRNNPGGLVSTLVQVASHFIDRGVVLTVVYRDGSEDADSVNVFASKIDLPMVVLVNKYSASAAEVLTGALQDYERAVIAGNKTYGKGSVNQLIPLSNGSGILMTIARWATPNGNLIEGKGIQPDIEVDFEKVDGVQWAIDYMLNQNK
jgi:carboxyl-terminal processing protease